MTDDLDRPLKRKTKRVFNKATGKHQDAAPKLDTTKWWKKKLGMGDKAKGSGALAKRRKKVIDSNIKAAD